MMPAHNGAARSLCLITVLPYGMPQVLSLLHMCNLLLAHNGAVRSRCLITVLRYGAHLMVITCHLLLCNACAPWHSMAWQRCASEWHHQMSRLVRRLRWWWCFLCAVVALGRRVISLEFSDVERAWPADIVFSESGTDLALVIPRICANLPLAPSACVGRLTSGMRHAFARVEGGGHTYGVECVLHCCCLFTSARAGHLAGGMKHGLGCEVQG